MLPASPAHTSLTVASVLIVAAVSSSCESPNGQPRDAGSRQSMSAELSEPNSSEVEQPVCDWPVHSADVAEVAKCLDSEAWGSMPLLRAIGESADARQIRLLLAAGADVNEREDSDSPFVPVRTPVGLAVARGADPAVIDALLAADPDLDADSTLLYWAVRNGPALVSKLVAAGANVHGRGECRTHHWCWRETPLHAAALYADYEEYTGVLEVLIAAGANVDARDGHGLTPFFWASLGNWTAAELLLAAGADVNARSSGGFRQRHGEERHGPAEIQFNRPMGPAIYTETMDGETPLHWAAAYGNRATVALLLAAGADADARGPQDATPLHWAVDDREDTAILTALVAAGANVNARDQFGSTPLHWATEYKQNPEVIAFLLAAGADVNARDSHGGTSLFGAAQNPAVFEGLVAAGAATDVRKNDGETLLHRAASLAVHRRFRWLDGHDDPAVFMQLLAAGADIHARDAHDTTPLHVAAAFTGWANRWRGPAQLTSTAVIDSLLAGGANVNARDAYGRTPLHSAARFNQNLAVVEALLAAGADACARDAYGLKPSEWTSLDLHEVLGKHSGSCQESPGPPVE